ncbi:MAG: reprolysin-like metallopeptidase [Pseudomonadota bacterium]
MRAPVLASTILVLSLLSVCTAANGSPQYQLPPAPVDTFTPLAYGRNDIVVSPSVWEPSDKLYVLPVFVVASDRGHLAENPQTPGLDFDGDVMHPTALANFQRARDNMSAHLQIARRMYHRMLRNPLNGEPRGTFRLASWRPETGRATVVSDYHAPVEPLVVQVPSSASSIATQQDVGIYSFIDDVMAPLGCRQTSCPFLLMMVIVGDAGVGTGAQKLNHGFNGGGGFGIFRWLEVRDANRGDASCLRLQRQVGRPPQDNWVDNGCSHFQSTLVHELGHAFGLNHSWEYGGTGSYYDREDSDSIMSYNVMNWIPGCGQGNAAPGAHSACTYPASHDVIDNSAHTWPGALLADDLRVLDRNRRAFPDLGYHKGLDAPGGTQTVLHQVYAGATEIPGQKRLYLVPGLTQEGWPNSVIGGGSEAALQLWEPWNARRAWTLGPAAPGLTSFFQVIFPGDVELTTVRFYSGHGGEQPVPGAHYNTIAEAQVGCGGCLDGGFDVLGSTTFVNGLNDSASLQPHTATDTYQVNLVHTSSYVTLRGVRFWGRQGGTGPVVELYPAGEPEVSTSGATWDGDISAIAGSNQTIKAFTDSFSPADSWHSDAVSCGDWISVDVDFPDDVQLGFVKAHTGHSGQYHVPDMVQVERECACRGSNTGVGGVCDAGLSQAACNAAGGPGATVFEFVDREVVDADHLLGFAPTSAHRWRIALHTPESPDQCYAVIRGLRFFNADGLEWFPARSRPPGE